MVRPTSLAGTVVAERPPPSCLGEGIPILLGIQHKTDVEQVVTVSGADESFSFELAVVTTADGIDFRGPYVHGRRGDRFLYLVWGHPDEGGELVRFARSKLMLSDLSPQLVRQALAAHDHGLTCTMEATNDQGAAASGTIRPPRASWALA